MKERFGVPVRSSNLRFLHLRRRGASVPKTITSTTNAINSDRDPALWVALGAGAATAGALAVSEDGPAVAASAAAGLTVSGDDGLAIAASAALGLTVCGDGLTGTAAAGAFVAKCLRAWDDGRVG